MVNMAGESMESFSMDQGQSLDSIVSHNDKENRRRSMPVYARAPQMQMDSPDSRRLSMMNFGSPGAGGVDTFRFDMSAAGMQGMMRNNSAYSGAPTSADMQSETLHNTDLAINTQFQSQNSPFSTIAAPGSAYVSPMHHKGSLDIDMSPFPNSLPMPLDMDDSMSMMPPDMTIFPPNQFNSPMLDSPVNQDFAGQLPPASQDNNTPVMQPPDQYKNLSLSNTPDARSGTSSFTSRANSQDQISLRSLSRPESEQRSSNGGATGMSLASLKQQQPVALNPAQDLSKETINKQMNNFKSPKWAAPAGGFPSTMHSNPHMKTQFKNAYSSTGFDMLAVLVRFRQDDQSRRLT